MTAPTRRAFWLVTAAVLGVWALHNAFLLRWEHERIPQALAEPGREQPARGLVRGTVSA